MKVFEKGGQNPAATWATSAALHFPPAHESCRCGLDGARGARLGARQTRVREGGRLVALDFEGALGALDLGGCAKKRGCAVRCAGFGSRIRPASEWPAHLRLPAINGWPLSIVG
jgi:hypothetical protein